MEKEQKLKRSVFIAMLYGCIDPIITDHYTEGEERTLPIGRNRDEVLAKGTVKYDKDGRPMHLTVQVEDQEDVLEYELGTTMDKKTLMRDIAIDLFNISQGKVHSTKENT